MQKAKWLSGEALQRAVKRREAKSKEEKEGKPRGLFGTTYIKSLNDCTVGGMNRFKGLDLIDRVPDEIWMEVCDTVQETGIKTIPRKKKCKKPNCCLRRPYK